jgi:hypothetical protein
MGCGFDFKSSLIKGKNAYWLSYSQGIGGKQLPDHGTALGARL